jgi:hypothetical protein
MQDANRSMLVIISVRLGKEGMRFCKSGALRNLLEHRICERLAARGDPSAARVASRLFGAIKLIDGSDRGRSRNGDFAHLGSPHVV